MNLDPKTIEKFVSRKLIVTAITVVGLVLAKAYTAAAATVIAYVLAQAHVDSKQVVADAQKVEPVLVAGLETSLPDYRAEIDLLKSQLDKVLADLAPDLPPSPAAITSPVPASVVRLRRQRPL